MPSADEAIGLQSTMQAALDAGLEQLSQHEQVEFQRYRKYVLERDGFVFWVATGEKMFATGSLHYATDRHQDEDQTIGANRLIFSSESEVSRFNSIAPLEMWIGAWAIPGGKPLKVAFSRRSSFYREAKIWHYDGFAVYPAFETQLIESEKDIPRDRIVSNSLPIWLLLNEAAPVYPSFLVPDNVQPPYIVAHIDPALTESLAAAPFVGPWADGRDVPGSDGAERLLPLSVPARDTVTLTLYGFDNHAAWQYLRYVYNASETGAAPFGFANSPVPVDEKRSQVELSALAQKKTITIVANYDQYAANIAAVRLLLSACVSHVWINGWSGAISAAGISASQVGAAIGEVDE